MQVESITEFIPHIPSSPCVQKSDQLPLSHTGGAGNQTPQHPHPKPTVNPMHSPDAFGNTIGTSNPRVLIGRSHSDPPLHWRHTPAVAGAVESVEHDKLDTQLQLAGLY